MSKKNSVKIWLVKYMVGLVGVVEECQFLKSDLVAEKKNSKTPHLVVSPSQETCASTSGKTKIWRKNQKRIQVPSHTWWDKMRPHHMTDSSHQSFRKLKSVTLTLKTGLGGVQNELVTSLGFCIPCFVFRQKGLLVPAEPLWSPCRAILSIILLQSLWNPCGVLVVTL